MSKESNFLGNCTVNFRTYEKNGFPFLQLEITEIFRLEITEIFRVKIKLRKTKFRLNSVGSSSLFLPLKTLFFPFFLPLVEFYLIFFPTAKET